MDPIPLHFQLTGRLKGGDKQIQAAAYIIEKLNRDTNLPKLVSDKSHVSEIQKRLLDLKLSPLIFDRVGKLEVINKDDFYWILGFTLITQDYRCIEILPDKTFVCYNIPDRKLVFVQTGETNLGTVEAFTSK